MLSQRIRIAPSGRLALILCGVHVAAAGAIGPVPAPMWATVAVTAAIAASLAFQLWRTVALRAPGAIVALAINEDGRLSCQTGRGDWLECELLPSSFVSPRLTIVNLRPRGERRARHVLLVPGSVDAGDFRRLRTWLRWAGHRVAQEA